MIKSSEHSFVFAHNEIYLLCVLLCHLVMLKELLEENFSIYFFSQDFNCSIFITRKAFKTQFSNHFTIELNYNNNMINVQVSISQYIFSIEWRTFFFHKFTQFDISSNFPSWQRKFNLLTILEFFLFLWIWRICAMLSNWTEPKYEKFSLFTKNFQFS